jgi:hypothetical protein
MKRLAQPRQQDAQNLGASAETIQIELIKMGQSNNSLATNAQISKNDIQVNEASTEKDPQIQTISDPALDERLRNLIELGLIDPHEGPVVRTRRPRGALVVDAYANVLHYSHHSYSSLASRGWIRFYIR